MHVDASSSLRTFQFTDFSFFVNAHNVSDSSEKNSNLRVLDQKNRFCNRPNFAETVLEVSGNEKPAGGPAGVRQSN
jgi:hypothetical protein